MARSRAGRRGLSGDYWPGFVDVMSTLLLVVTFLLSLFMLAQYFVSQEVSSKDTALLRLNRQIAQLTNLLALERSKKKGLEEELATLSATLASTEAERNRLKGLLSAAGKKGQSSDSRIIVLTDKLSKEKEIAAQALSQVELLNQQIAALRRQLASLTAALDASEQRDKESQAKIADLGRRLNAALARKVQELAKYRSDFFGRLRQVLGARKDIQIVGDRFVFQAELFFDSGSAEINPAGKLELDKLADVLKQIETEIPSNINWVLRVDGHTDIRPIATAAFPSNWELSSARAISVVKYLMGRGIAPGRLVAAGFGEHQPLAQGSSEEDLRRNRRIELKLTEK